MIKQCLQAMRSMGERVENWGGIGACESGALHPHAQAVLQAAPDPRKNKGRSCRTGRGAMAALTAAQETAALPCDAQRGARAEPSARPVGQSGALGPIAGDPQNWNCWPLV